MKYATSGEIIEKALYNIYGTGAIDATVRTAALHKFYDILDRVQREFTLFFSKQKQEFAITANDAEYAVIGDIFAATGFGKLGRIYGLSIKTATSLYKLKRLEQEAYDVYNMTSPVGQPIGYVESYMKEVPTDHTLTLYPMPAEAYTGILYYKRIYLPEDWTDIEYSHFILDELCDYLVHQLSGELCMDMKAKDKAGDHFMMALNYISKVLSRNNDYHMQTMENRIKPIW
jgi:hypothetical protein